MSFKLQQASTGGDQRLAGKQVIYQPNTLLLQVEGTLENSTTKFLLDSGAAVSVVRPDHLSLESRSKIDPDVLPAVSADGNSLDVLGQVTLPVSVGEFHTNHKFVVMRNLTVVCRWAQIF